MFDFSALTNWIHAGLLSFMPEWLAVTTECVLIGLVLLTVYALLALFYIYYLSLIHISEPTRRP